LPEKLRASAKRILAKTFVLPFSSSEETEPIGRIAKILELDESDVSRQLAELERSGYIEIIKGTPRLTEHGRSAITVVFAGGSFDIIHPGHIETLEQSKALGDVLVVSVARDATFERNKKRKPFFDENIRRRSVSALRCVDVAVLGSETDIFATVEKIRPDVITLGYDQHHQEKLISDEVRKRGIKVKVVRLGSSIPEAKTSKMISDNPDIIKDS